MKTTCRLPIVFFALVGLIRDQSAFAQVHAFEVKDAITMNRFSDLSETGSRRSALSSPDGKYFAVVTSKGNLETNTIESAISIFKAGDILGRLHHTSEGGNIRRVVCRLRSIPQGAVSESYSPVISSLRWSSDSHELYFLAATSNGRHRLYRAT